MKTQHNRNQIGRKLIITLCVVYTTRRNETVNGGPPGERRRSTWELLKCKCGQVPVTGIKLDCAVFIGDHD
ncbi:hypothetical protein BDFB_009707 [Asbolus verrucosus]|uniref:Uncharacterized protein n=1 Tax=Asbolus verrucosus TaxID=1661398 RepID=A0A482W8Z2_ASBVE|nr:hypothetical protein BDFB_009707 [Asbolus verrucosus]